ncbi:unnamed protein product [Cuscuta campestris]|uniref:cytokinin riboside 5'-monophosphate phosphoribohydrolase n=1 Tax=Cuscuta campestris TaxID=132261 RepID=A0A484MWS0_9ASTE|nr:unnamed protein product [Cuscuta campestris]
MASAVDLGRELIRRKIRLTYGGGNTGLQGAVASTISTNGGIVRGFISWYIAARQVYGPTHGAEYTVSSNYYKYFEMNHVVEAFIILSGGIDTMEGLLTVILWASDGLHNKPIGVLKIDGYFNNLIKFLDDAVRQNFMSLSQRKLFIFSFFVGELLDKLEFAKAFPGPGFSFFCVGLLLKHPCHTFNEVSVGCSLDCTAHHYSIAYCHIRVHCGVSSLPFEDLNGWCMCNWIFKDFKSYDSRSNFLLWIVACSVILPRAALLECVILIITVVPAQKTNRGQSNCKSCEIVSER